MRGGRRGDAGERVEDAQGGRQQERGVHQPAGRRRAARDDARFVEKGADGRTGRRDGRSGGSTARCFSGAARRQATLSFTRRSVWQRQAKGERSGARGGIPWRARQTPLRPPFYSKKKKARSFSRFVGQARRTAARPALGRRCTRRRSGELFRLAARRRGDSLF